MILGTEAIREGLYVGAILCDPAPERVEGAQIDITLGEYWWTFKGEKIANKPSTHLYLGITDPEKCFTQGFAVAKRVLVPARGFILAHTEEYIGTAPGSGLVPMLHTRSTLARWGLSICTANAGQGDEGYASRWTLEIVNAHPVAIALPVGARVGSISFHRVEGSAAAYEGRYNVTREEWQPSAMLPRKGNW